MRRQDDAPTMRKKYDFDGFVIEAVPREYPMNVRTKPHEWVRDMASGRQPDLYRRETQTEWDLMVGRHRVAVARRNPNGSFSAGMYNARDFEGLVSMVADSLQRRRMAKPSEDEPDNSGPKM